MVLVKTSCAHRLHRASRNSDSQTPLPAGQTSANKAAMAMSAMMLTERVSRTRAGARRSRTRRGAAQEFERVRKDDENHRRRPRTSHCPGLRFATDAAARCSHGAGGDNR